MGEDKRRMKEEDGVLSCRYYLQKKKRYCRLQPLTSQTYCAEHIPVTSPSNLTVVTGEKNILQRQPCPYDPNHTVAISSLKEHLARCNSRPPVELAFFKAQAVKASETAPRTDTEKPDIWTMSQSSKLRLIQTIIELHKRHVAPVPDHIGIQSHLLTDFVRTDVGSAALRHSAQIASIVKLLEDHALLQDSTCFIEFGSGRGGLSLGIARVVQAMGLRNCKIILVDRTSPRYKKDNIAKTECKDVVIERVKLSIEDMIVGKLPDIENYRNIVGVAKHLCGVGTDVALRGFLSDLNSQRDKVRGLVFASCCHHRTEYDELAGVGYFTDQITNTNFRAIKQIAAWATNGNYTLTYMDVDDPDYAFNLQQENEILKYLEVAESEYPDIKLSHAVGRLAKQLIDKCRVEYVKKQNLSLSCKLVYYVDMETTRENVAIVAFRNS